jgi:hypothetical protein
VPATGKSGLGSASVASGEVDDVSRFHLDIERNARSGGRLDAGEAQDEGRRVVARHFIVAVEQVHLVGAGARCVDGEMPDDLLA